MIISCLALVTPGHSFHMNDYRQSRIFCILNCWRSNARHWWKREMALTCSLMGAFMLFLSPTGSPFNKSGSSISWTTFKNKNAQKTWISWFWPTELVTSKILFSQHLHVHSPMRSRFSSSSASRSANSHCWLPCFFQLSLCSPGVPFASSCHHCLSSVSQPLTRAFFSWCECPLLQAWTPSNYELCTQLWHVLLTLQRSRGHIPGCLLQGCPKSVTFVFPSHHLLRERPLPYRDLRASIRTRLLAAVPAEYTWNTSIMIISLLAFNHV